MAMQQCQGPLSGCFHYHMDMEMLRNLKSNPFSMMWEAGLMDLIYWNCQKEEGEAYVKFLLKDLLDEYSFEMLVVLATHLTTLDPRYSLVDEEINKRYVDAGARNNFIHVPGSLPQRIIHCRCAADFRGVIAIATGAVPLSEMLRALTFVECQRCWFNGQAHCIVAGTPMHESTDAMDGIRFLQEWES